jgi:hypothetical protein
MITPSPKEKAKELVNKFSHFTVQEKWELKNYYAMECALIAVDEILKCHMWKYNSIEPYKFWQEVKNEIENYKNE